MKKVNIHEFEDESGQVLRGLFFDDVLFDWGMDQESLRQAKLYAQRDYGAYKGVCGDFQKHFLTSLAEFLGYSMTLKELNEAIKAGRTAWS
jgi:hypothetical protein